MSYSQEAIEAELDAMGLDWEDPSSDGWAWMLCPLHDDTTPSMSVNLEHGGWRCAAGCGSGRDLARLVAEVTETDVRDVRRRIERSSAFDPDAVGRAWSKGRLAKSEPAVDPELEYDRDSVPQYALRRGFDLETLRAWEAGFDPELPALVIPARDEAGIVVGLVRRRVTDEQPKYVNTRGMPKVLFGAEHLPFGLDLVVLVEGPLDAMWLAQHGLAGVATLGGAPTDEQLSQLRRLLQPGTVLVLAFDDDEAGERAERVTRRRLSDSRINVRLARLPEGRKDVQECSGDELREMVATAVTALAAF